MGITQFYACYGTSGKEVNIYEYLEARAQEEKDKGRKYILGIDGFWILHKYAYDAKIAEALVKQPDTYNEEFVTRIKAHLLEYLAADLEIVMVFDGAVLGFKQATEDKRKDAREKAKKEGKWIQAVDITNRHAYWIIKAFEDDARIRFVTAPFEADAQLAWLAKNGVVDAILLSDTDLLMQDLDEVILERKRKVNNIYETYHEVWPNVFNGDNSRFYKYFYPIILGCDYLPGGIEGVAAKKGKTMIQKLIALCDTYLKTEGKDDFQNAGEFIDCILNELVGPFKLEASDLKLLLINVLMSYRAQPVFYVDFDGKKLIFKDCDALNPKATGVKYGKYVNKDGILDEDFCINVAKGYVDPITGTEFTPLANKRRFIDDENTIIPKKSINVVDSTN